MTPNEQASSLSFNTSAAQKAPYTCLRLDKDMHTGQNAYAVMHATHWLGLVLWLTRFFALQAVGEQARQGTICAAKAFYAMWRSSIDKGR